MEALSEPTRLRLLGLLERHELGVVELCDVLQLPQSTVSRHLKVLLERGWVRHRKHATTHLYRMILDELDPPTRKLWLLAREQTDGWATLRQDQLRLTRRLRQRQTDTRQFFAGAVGQWDKLRRELYGDRFNTEALLALLPGDWTIADLGCGTAGLAAELASHVRQVIGVDNSPAMLKAARRRTDELANVELRQGELESLPIETGTCDAAMLVLVLSYAADPSVVLREMCRILKPGGKAVVVDLLPHDRDDFRRQMGQQHAGFDPAAFATMLASAGFSHPNLRPLPPEPSAKGPALFLATADK
jgi:ArsR family transcriptional regulator